MRPYKVAAFSQYGEFKITVVRAGIKDIQVYPPIEIGIIIALNDLNVNMNFGRFSGKRIRHALPGVVCKGRKRLISEALLGRALDVQYISIQLFAAVQGQFECLLVCPNRLHLGSGEFERAGSVPETSIVNMHIGRKKMGRVWTGYVNYEVVIPVEDIFSDRFRGAPQKPSVCLVPSYHT